jgi:L-alanine-DL-glutamate epimerase-like enolase superfamily enzyme
VRADANNLWHDADTCISDLLSLEFRFAGLEEPLQPGDFPGLKEVAEAAGVRIILDESASRREHLECLGSSPGRWILNCRVSKMGGLVRSLRMLGLARSLGLGVILGAHVGETSVLTRAALALTAATPTGLVGQEGAFGTHLLQQDVAEPSLMFGSEGILDVAQAGIAGAPGLGLTIAERRQDPPLASA